jgi:hypothetical protein
LAIESWIDEIAKLAGEVEDGRGGHVRSYSVFERAEFPESLSLFPCALTYATEVTCQVSEGLCIDLWKGTTEFHLFPDVAKNHYPEIMLYFARIRNAFALHRKLAGKVAYCQLVTEEGPSIQGPVVLQYGSEEPHLGLIARWVVKENVTGKFTLGV